MMQSLCEWQAALLPHGLYYTCARLGAASKTVQNASGSNPINQICFPLIVRLRIGRRRTYARDCFNDLERQVHPRVLWAALFVGESGRLARDRLPGLVS